MPSKIYIFGIGSPFGDDQAGWLVIDELQKRIALEELLKESISLVKYDRPNLNILADTQVADYVYLIDAVITGNAPIGTINEFNQAQIINTNELVSTHGVSIAEALAIGKALGNLPENIRCYGIEIEPSNTIAGVSSEVLHAIQHLTDKLIIQIRAMLLLELK